MSTVDKFLEYKEINGLGAGVYLWERFGYGDGAPWGMRGAGGLTATSWPGIKGAALVSEVVRNEGAANGAGRSGRGGRKRVGLKPDLRCYLTGVR